MGVYAPPRLKFTHPTCLEWRDVGESYHSRRPIRAPDTRDVHHTVVPAVGRSARFEKRGYDTVSVWRWNLHAAVTALAISPFALGLNWGISLPFVPEHQRAAAVESTGDSASVPVAMADARTAVPEPGVPDEARDLGVVAERHLGERIATYRVRRGDTLNAIALQSGITTNTIMWANKLTNPDRLVPGQELTILPVDGVLVTASDGDTVEALATRHGGAVRRLVEANGLAEPFALRAGDRVLIPGGRPAVAPAPLRSTAWPEPGTGDRNKRQFIEAAALAAQDSHRRTRVPV